MSTWLGPAFKSTVNNSYQLAQKYIDQTEKNLITDSKFIRNYVMAERLIDRDIIQRFDIISVYNVINDQKIIEHFTDDKIELFSKNIELVSNKTDNDITIFFQNNQLLIFLITQNLHQFLQKHNNQKIFLRLKTDLFYFEYK